MRVKDIPNFEVRRLISSDSKKNKKIAELSKKGLMGFPAGIKNLSRGYPGQRAMVVSIYD